MLASLLNEQSLFFSLQLDMKSIGAKQSIVERDDKMRTAEGVKKGTCAYRALYELYYARRMRVYDLRTINRGVKPETITAGLKKLESERLIETDKDGAVSITDKGDATIIEKLGKRSYEYKYRSLIKEEWRTASRNGTKEEYLDQEKARSMFTFYDVPARYNKKISLKDLIDRLNASSPWNDIKYVGEPKKESKYPPYMPSDKLSETELEDYWANGAFYTKREVMEYIDMVIPTSTDITRPSRFKGLYVSSTRIIVVYTQPYNAEGMFKLTYADVYTKEIIEKTIYASLENFMRSNSPLECIVISDGDGLVWEMTTGWKYGHITEAHKRLLQNSIKKNRGTLGDSLEAVRANDITGHVTVEKTNYSIVYARNSPAKRLNIFYSGTSPYDHVYVIPNNIKGLLHLRTLLYHTDDEIYESGYQKIFGKEAPAINMTADYGREYVMRSNRIYRKGSDWITYQPFFDIMVLAKLSCDGSLAQEYETDSNGTVTLVPLNVYTYTDCANAISHSLRRKVTFFNADNPKHEIKNIRRYNYDGWVIEGNDPYAARRKPAKERRPKYKPVNPTLHMSEEEQKLWKAEAEKAGLSFNAFVKQSVRKVIAEKKAAEEGVKQEEASSV